MKEYESKDFDFLIGKKINRVEQTSHTDIESYDLYTDNEKITIKTNQGCGGCGSGWSSIDDLKVLEGNGIITNVRKVHWKDYEGYTDSFELFIYYHDKTLEIKGNDGWGNGYYGGGFHVIVERIETNKKPGDDSNGTR